MIAIAFANATVRELWLAPRFAPADAHRLSTATLVIALVGYMAWAVPRLRIDRVARAVSIGLVWASSTIAFEALLGWFAGQSWSDVLRQYDVASGNLWIAVPLSLLVAPAVLWLVGRRRAARR